MRWVLCGREKGCVVSVRLCGHGPGADRCWGVFCSKGVRVEVVRLCVRWVLMLARVAV